MAKNACFGSRIYPSVPENYDDASLVAYTKSRARGMGGGGERALQFADGWPELANYKFPSTFRSDHQEVLFSQLKQRTRTPLETACAALAIPTLADLIGEVPSPRWLRCGITLADIDRALQVGDRTKSPGFPLTSLFRTKGESYDAVYWDLVQAVLMRIICLNVVGPFCRTWADFYYTFCCDAKAFSIKREVVKIAKRGRALIAMSYVDAAVEALLYSNYTARMKAQVYESHSMIGVGFTADDGAILRAIFPGNRFSSDVPTFDASFVLDERLDVKEAIHIAMNAKGTLLERVGVLHEYALSMMVFVTPDGDIFAPYSPSGQCSGRPLTSQLNTDGRTLRSLAVDIWLKATHDVLASALVGSAGDDCNEDPTEHREDGYAALGLPLRDVEITSDWEFCSFKWDPVHGVRIHKALFLLLNAQPLTVDHVRSFVVNFGHHPRFQDAITFASKSRTEVKSHIDFIIQHAMNATRLPEQPELLAGNILGRICLPSAGLSDGRDAHELAESASFEVDLHGKRKKQGKKKSTKVVTKVVVKRAGPVRQPRANRTNAIMFGAHEVCAVSNPFCPEAIGSKWPDGAMYKTIPFSLEKTSFTYANSAAGYAASMFVGDVNQNIGASGFTYPNITYAATLAPVATMPANISKYRLTSWGLKVCCVSTPMNTQGTLRIRLFSPSDGAGLGSVSMTSELADEVYDIPVARLINKDLFIVPQPLGTVAPRTFREFSAASSTVASWVNPGWQIVQVALDAGQANVTSIQVTCYYHFEYTPLDGDSQYAFATPSPKTNLAVQQANSTVLDRVGTMIEGTASKVDSVFKSQAFKYLAAGAAAVFTRNPSTALTVYQGADAYSARSRAPNAD